MAAITALFEEDAVPEPKRWTVEQFVRFYECGELGGETDHFELLDGEILQKLGQNEPHIHSLRLAIEALQAAFGIGSNVSQQVPITLGEFSRPEPDLTVLKGRARDFDGRSVTAADVALLVEIVDSRMDTARQQKVPIYAKHGIAEYWIVDLRKRVVEVRRGPIAETGEWKEMRIYDESESIEPSARPGSSVAVEDLLPRKA